jgi:hypothetical protein
MSRLLTEEEIYELRRLEQQARFKFTQGLTYHMTTPWYKRLWDKFNGKRPY